MKWVAIVLEAVAGLLLADLLSKAANDFWTDIRNQAPVGLPKMGDLKSLMHHWRSLSRWGREYVASSFIYTDGKYLIYNSPQPIITQIA